MSTQNFTTTLVVDATPSQVFNAVNRPENWWSGDVEGTAKKVGDEFVYRYKDLHCSKQQVIEMIPDQKIVWFVTDSIINYADDKDEWKGTKISFEISKQGDKTQVLFSHLGLVPEVECFNSCSNSWSQIIHQSLGNLIKTGEGLQLFLG